MMEALCLISSLYSICSRIVAAKAYLRMRKEVNICMKTGTGGAAPVKGDEPAGEIKLLAHVHWLELLRVIGDHIHMLRHTCRKEPE